MEERKRRILLIDDDPDCVEATVKVLKSQPYEVIVASNGKEGLAKAKKEKPDLVLLDILMPVVDGFAVADEFNKSRMLRKIPVIALTSFSEAMGQPFPFQVAEYVNKPVSPRDLLDKVEKHLK
jgi:two-component system alkaline phosphatase synthesis response regulator PhoP